MIGHLWTGLCAVGCFAGAIALEPPTLASLREPAQWIMRPAALPFAWRSLDEAMRTGDANESFARAQQILQLVPSWTDAQVVFAFRFATDGGSALPAAKRPQAAHSRLLIALLWLESARDVAGRREIELLQSMALLPEIAVGQEPGLAELLQREGGTAALADRYLAVAEKLSGSPTVREQRTFRTVALAAAFLDNNDRAGAVRVLEAGIARSADVRDRTTATEWATRLREVTGHLSGEPVDLTAVRADLRMASLLPYLR